MADAKSLHDEMQTAVKQGKVLFADDDPLVRDMTAAILLRLGLEVVTAADGNEALERFRNFPALRRRLQVLTDTGLGYVRLGQPTPTLSGGEQQRLKLGAHLLGTQLRHTVFLLDEPTTGLHFADIDTLCALVHHLVDAGNTVIAIEHNLDFIAQADHVLDLGPGGGESANSQPVIRSRLTRPYPRPLSELR